MIIDTTKIAEQFQWRLLRSTKVSIFIFCCKHHLTLLPTGLQKALSSLKFGLKYLYTGICTLETCIYRLIRNGGIFIPAYNRLVPEKWYQECQSLQSESFHLRRAPIFWPMFEKTGQNKGCSLLKIS